MKEHLQRVLGLLSALILAPMLLYASGIVAQFIININAWKAAGSDYNVSPGLPSLQIKDVALAIVHFPEGPIAVGVVVVGVFLFCVFGLGISSGEDSALGRLVISKSHSYGSATFMDEAEARECFDIVSPAKTAQDILGQISRSRVFTLPKDTRLNANLAICGASGTGKSRSISRNLILQAAKRGESVIVTDPKSELYESMSGYLRDQGYTVRVLNLIQMDHSDSWNCLGEVGGSELMATTLADVILSNTGDRNNDAFWYSAELNLLKALILYVALELPKEEERTLAKVYELICTNSLDDLTTKMIQVGKARTNPMTGEYIPPSPAWPPYSIFMQASATVQSSVVIGLGSKLQVLQNEQVKSITSYNEIDLVLPGKQKCAYFCIVSDQDSTFNFLSSLFFSFLFIRLIRYADYQCEGGVLPTKVKFVLDEFPNCCLIPDFTKKCSTIRSRGCSVAVFFQNVGQMRNRYPDDQWQEILGACDSTVFLGCTDMLTADYFSKRIGSATVEVEGTSRDLSAFQVTDHTNMYRKTKSLGRRQLMTSDEVLRMKPDEELVFIRGQKVFKAKRFDYSRHPEYKKLHSERAMLYTPEWKKRALSAAPKPVFSVPTPAKEPDHGQAPQKEPTEKPAYEPTLGRIVGEKEIFQ